jgi:hypothetical protein
MQKQLNHRNGPKGRMNVRVKWKPQDHSCVFLNLLWLNSALARLPQQQEPVVCHTCAREFHCGRIREVLEELGEILRRIYPDSFLFHTDPATLRYKKPDPRHDGICLMDLEIWLAQLRPSWKRVAAKIGDSGYHSVADTCRLFPPLKMQSIYGESTKDYNQRLMDQIWLWGHPANNPKMP